VWKSVLFQEMCGVFHDIFQEPRNMWSIPRGKEELQEIKENKRTCSKIIRIEFKDNYTWFQEFLIPRKITFPVH
jgi:hypothetical protein